MYTVELCPLGFYIVGLTDDEISQITGSDDPPQPDSWSPSGAPIWNTRIAAQAAADYLLAVWRESLPTCAQCGEPCEVSDDDGVCADCNEAADDRRADLRAYHRDAL